MRSRPFYTPGENIGEFTIGGTKIISYEDTVLFLISNFQYVVTAIAFSNAKPHRKEIYTNKPFFLSIIFILMLDTTFVFMTNPGVSLLTQNTDGTNWLANFFLLEPFYLSYDG